MRRSTRRPARLPNRTDEQRDMWIVIIAGLLITLPAIVVALLNLNHPMAIPALASFGVNSLPFLFGAYLFARRKREGGGDEDGH